jgi:hypothetical protein
MELFAGIFGILSLFDDAELLLVGFFTSHVGLLLFKYGPDLRALRRAIPVDSPSKLLRCPGSAFDPELGGATSRIFSPVLVGRS